MRHEIPEYIRSFLNPGSSPDSTAETAMTGIRPRAFLVGSAFSFFLAIGAPYGNMLVKGAYIAQDATTPPRRLSGFSVRNGLPQHAL